VGWGADPSTAEAKAAGDNSNDAGLVGIIVTARRKGEGIQDASQTAQRLLPIVSNL